MTTFQTKFIDTDIEFTFWLKSIEGYEFIYRPKGYVQKKVEPSMIGTSRTFNFENIQNCAS
jgi:hypothetical protein